MASVVGTSTFPDVIVPRPRPLSPNVKGLLEGLWEATRRLPAARARRKRWHWAAPHKRLGSLASPAYNERSGKRKTMKQTKQSVLITGGTDGLGKSAALFLAERGYRVFAAGAPRGNGTQTTHTPR